MVVNHLAEPALVNILMSADEHACSASIQQMDFQIQSHCPPLELLK